MVLNVLFILIGVIYLAASYFIGIKKNLNFISFFMLGFTERLVKDKNKHVLSICFALLFILVGSFFIVLGMTRML